MADSPEPERELDSDAASKAVSDAFGRFVFVRCVRIFRSGAQLGVGRDEDAFFVYDRSTRLDPWHKHCGPYASAVEAANWINAIRDEGAR